MQVDFLFVDEMGISLDPNQPYFGVGGLLISNTIDINRQLHEIFTGALSFLDQTKERFEFKFTYVTHRSLRFYKEIIEILKSTPNWRFEFLLEKKQAPWDGTTFWGKYLDYVNILVEKFPEKNLIIVSDYLAKPKKEKRNLFEVAENNSQVLNILQLESQGSLLLQAVDILLGGVAYQKRVEGSFRTDDLKCEVSNLVKELLRNKNEQL